MKTTPKTDGQGKELAKIAADKISCGDRMIQVFREYQGSHSWIMVPTSAVESIIQTTYAPAIDAARERLKFYVHLYQRKKYLSGDEADWDELDQKALALLEGK